MDFELRRKRLEQVSQNLLKRYHEHAQERQHKAEDIRRNGILEAAGMKAACARHAHMSAGMPIRFEKISGVDDLSGINFLSIGLRAARPVCRITQFGQALGTGFLVAPGLLLTNNHVIAAPDEAAVAIAEFDYELDAGNTPRQPRHFRLAPEVTFVTSDQNELDFTFVEVSPAGVNGGQIRDFGWLPLHPITDKILEGEPVVIIQHPDGRLKSLCLFNSSLEHRVDDYLHYNTDTEPGSSGSPVFNRHWQVVGLHHAGEVLTNDDGSVKRNAGGFPLAINEGIRISRILDALHTGKRTQQDGTRVAQRLTDPQVLRDGRPVMVSSTTPGGAAPETMAEMEARATKIQRREPQHYNGRKGYDSRFIGSGALEVPLPKAAEFMRSDLVRLTGSSETELKYMHFSVFMSKSRCLPIFTAVNIDGSSLVNLDRKDRDPNKLEGMSVEAAADKWFFDPRIDEKFQLGPKVYDDTDFAFGHVIRRLDPVWGDAKTLRIANDDTFHMTNCYPQHKNWNSGSWLQLENAYLKSAEETGKKFTVFTGPVMDPRDPFVLDVQIPLGGWKVVVFEENGQLASMGFIQWQDDLVQKIIDSTREAMPIDEVNTVWRYSVSDIAQISNLDFGVLVDMDVIEFESRRRRERVTERSLVRMFRRPGNN